MHGLRNATILVLLLLAVVITIAPEVDLEDGVLRLEFALYALLMAAISIIALPVVTSDSPRFVHAFLFSADPSGPSRPSAIQILRC